MSQTTNQITIVITLICRWDSHGEPTSRGALAFLAVASPVAVRLGVEFRPPPVVAAGTWVGPGGSWRVIAIKGANSAMVNIW